jgi:hypothetical protein
MADDKVKVTIRLPRDLTRLAKHQALARDEDLHDLIAAALADYLRPLPPPLDPKEGQAILTAMRAQMTDASRERVRTAAPTTKAQRDKSNRRGK